MTQNIDISDDWDIVYTACTENGYEILRHLLDLGIPFAEIVTISPDMAERNQVSGYQSYANIADRNEIPIYYPETFEMDSEHDHQHFEYIDADLMLVMGWQRLIPEAVLNTLTHGALGVHGSAYGLPKGRGRSPMNWSLIEGCSRFLHSVIRLTSDADAGNIVGTKKFDITPHDNIRTLYYKNVIATQNILADSLVSILQGEVELTQQKGEATYYPKRNPEDGAICWKEQTQTIYNLIRAVGKPYPGAFTEYKSERIFIWDAIPFSDDFVFDSSPGTIVQVFETTGDFVVKTADGSLLVRDWEASDGFQPIRGNTFRSFGKSNRVDIQQTE